MTPGSNTKTVVEAIIRCSSSSLDGEEEETDLGEVIVVVVVV